jgi:hypothetical protein
MIKISSYHLSKSDLSLLRKFSNFVLKKFVKNSTLNKSLVKIEVVHANDLDNSADIDDLRNYNAWCYYEGVQNDKKVFKVILNIRQVNKKAKKPLVRLKKLIVDLGHELVHVKQYMNNEIFDYVSGGVRYKGSVFDQSYQMDEQAYYESPWELEAYGREWGLYKMFSSKIKMESKR